jgi:hypothetical protein
MSELFARGGAIAEPMYRFLPVVYLLAGAAAFFGLQGAVGYVCGGMLWLAAALIPALRRNARLAQESE